MATLGIIYLDKDGLGKQAPFSVPAIELGYRLFSEYAAKKGLRVVLGSPTDYADGMFTEAWDLIAREKVRNVPIDAAWDRAFAQKNDFFIHHQALLADVAERMPLANHPSIAAVTEDKYETYRTFSSFVPQTFLASELEKARAAFGGRVVVKPRGGSHGDDVKIRDISEIEELPSDFIIQPLIDSRDGIPDVIEGVHDLRITVLNGTINDSYVRFPTRGLVSNVSLGGHVKYVEPARIPDAARKIAGEVDAHFARFVPRFYSIDFMLERGRPWLLELNKAPGIWGHEEDGRPTKDFEPMCIEIIDAFLASLE